ncbi:MAG: hypothetical protein ACYTEQ_15520 [Planctomycetota bacterium]|jgi:uncharacterized protein YcfL
MKKAILVSLLLLLVAGCTSYYKVTNPETDKVYYTNEVKYKGSGAVELKDAKTGAKVVLPSSEVQEIKKDEFTQGVYSGD